MSILFIIGKNKGVNQKVIADALVLDQSTMSRDIKKLADKGLISKHPDVDPRIWRLALTIKGCELLEVISPIWNELHQKVTALLGEYNVQNIDLIIQAIQQNVDGLKE